MVIINMEPTIKGKDAMTDVDFKWGEIQSKDMPGQLTRSMLDMQKPRAFELKELPPLPKEKVMSVCQDAGYAICPVTRHSIRLLMYIRQVESLLSDLDNKPQAYYGRVSEIEELSQPPAFQSNNLNRTLSKPRRRSSSPGRGDDDMSDVKFLVPELDHPYRDGEKTVHNGSLLKETASKLLESSVKTIAAHTGYDEMSTVSLSVLMNIAGAFMKKFSESLRDALDHEAETGHPPHYDVLHSVLSECNIQSLEEIRQFWNNRVVKRHKSLQEKASKMAKEVQSLKYSMHEAKVDNAQSPFHSTYSKWTPVAGMSSGPYHGHRKTENGGAWSKKSIKTETFDVKGSVNYFESESGCLQDSPFDFGVSGVSDNTFEMGDYDNYPARKKSRNAL